MTRRRPELRRAARARVVEEGLAATLASFGLMWASALLAVAAAGGLQWAALPAWLDNTVPLGLLGGGLVFAGRVAAGVAPGRGAFAALAAGALVIGSGLSLTWAAEAHGDGVEGQFAVVAGLLVAATSGASALWTDRRRSRYESEETQPAIRPNQRGRSQRPHNCPER